MIFDRDCFAENNSLDLSRVSALGIPIIGIPREKWDFTFPISQGKILKIPWEKFHFLKSHLV